MKALILIIPIFLAAIIFNASFYRVNEVEQIIITQFGEPIGDPVVDAGPHFKIPFIQKVRRFDKRWLEWDGDSGEMPTAEKTYIWVDTYARWRIVEPLKFFTSVRDEDGAQSRLDDIIDSETRNVIAAHNLIEVVRSSNRELTQATETKMEGENAHVQPTISVGRNKLTRMILEKAQLAMPEYGIELVDVQFQRVNYTASVKAKVFERMISERKRIADRYRSEGEGKRAETLGKKERELLTIESEAYRKVQEINGRADADATAIYAAAHNRDPELYRLLKTLESYKETVDDETWLLLSTESDFFAPLKKMSK